MECSKRLEEIVAKLRSQSMRLTPQRLAILKKLLCGDPHPTVEDVYTSVKIDFPMTSLATVYKTIALLKGLEEVVELHYDSQPSRYDAWPQSTHLHLICRKCRQVFDFEFDRFNALSKTIREKTGFRSTSSRVDIFGICPNCQNQ